MHQKRASLICFACLHPQDLRGLAGDTHKFESRYLDGLVGKYPEEEALYIERAPIESVAQLSCPVLLLQASLLPVLPSCRTPFWPCVAPELALMSHPIFSLRMAGFFLSI